MPGPASLPTTLACHVFAPIKARQCQVAHITLHYIQGATTSWCVSHPHDKRIRTARAVQHAPPPPVLNHALQGSSLTDCGMKIDTNSLHQQGIQMRNGRESMRLHKLLLTGAQAVQLWHGSIPSKASQHHLHKNRPLCQDMTEHKQHPLYGDRAQEVPLSTRQDRAAVRQC
eukprot:1149352-Pelagomonas_calceolata.AAC.3